MAAADRQTVVKPQSEDDPRKFHFPDLTPFFNWSTCCFIKNGSAHVAILFFCTLEPKVYFGFDTNAYHSVYTLK